MKVIRLIQKVKSVFQIAENGIFLNIDYRCHLQCYTTQLFLVSLRNINVNHKNADKQLMYDSFKEHTKKDLMKMFDMEKLNNPVTDIVDSYYIAKVGYENSKTKK